MSGIVLFAGPSLGGLAMPEGIDLRPPAAAGDVWRAAREAPRAIALVDGAFEGEASVWHKEVLFALSHGIHVLGASSMGALRAAELHLFGMVGVGAIFEAYRDGAIEGDDEVALLHGPGALGWPVLTLPLVDVRASVRAAEAAGLVAAPLLARARAIHWKDRTWARVLEGAEPALAAWVGANAVDAKRADAAHLLERLAAGALGPAPAPRRFVPTDAWQAATKAWGAKALEDAQPARGWRLTAARRARA